MADFEYLGSLELDLDGNVRVRAPQIAPAPRRAAKLIRVSARLAQRFEAGRVLLSYLLGDSMQPGILHNDTVVVSLTRRPRAGDVVLVKAERPDPIYGEIAGCVWRYHGGPGHAYLTKDNPRYRERRSVTEEKIRGVVTQVIPRESRDEHENHELMEQCRAMARSCGEDEPEEDLGYFLDRRVAGFRSAFRIPESELVAGRLPWGLFRAAAVENHPHVGIELGDILTVEPTIQSHVGLVVVKRNRRGKTIIGVLGREERDTRQPGEFYVDLPAKRVRVSERRGELPTWETVAVVRRIERRGVVVPLPSVSPLK
jgi:hypothetical protein